MCEKSTRTITRLLGPFGSIAIYEDARPWLEMAVVCFTCAVEGQLFRHCSGVICLASVRHGRIRASSPAQFVMALIICKSTRVNKTGSCLCGLPGVLGMLGNVAHLESLHMNRDLSSLMCCFVCVCGKQWQQHAPSVRNINQASNVRIRWLLLPEMVDFFKAQKKLGSKVLPNTRERKALKDKTSDLIPQQAGAHMINPERGR